MTRPLPKRNRLTRRISIAGVSLFVLSIAVCCALPSFESSFEGDQAVRRARIGSSTTRDAYQLSVLRSGNPDGQQVVFVHGTPGNAANFLDVLQHVPEGFEFVSYDRPGFDRTRPKSEVVSLDEHAAALLPLLETRGGRRPILVGHSYGGPVVVSAAANYPDRIGGVLVLAGSLDPDLEAILWVQYVAETPPFVWLIPRAIRATNREILALEDELRALEPKLGFITAPVTIMHGTDDTLVPYENVAYMQKHLTNAETVEVLKLVGDNHFLPWTRQALILEAITRIAAGYPGDPQPETVFTHG